MVNRISDTELVNSSTSSSVSSSTECLKAPTRGETIYRYINILQYLLLQYNTIWLIENIDILHITIYC